MADKGGNQILVMAPSHEERLQGKITKQLGFVFSVGE